MRMPSSAPGIPTLDMNGAVIPRLGLGTWQLGGERCERIVAAALGMGYTHIDTAQGYDNEAAVGNGFAASGVDRNRVFIATKVRPDRMGDGDLQRSVEESLRKLRVSEIDLLLHWPNPAIPLTDSIRALNDVRRQGMVRHIGLSNFPSALLAEAWRLTREPLAAEQVEYHPYLDQRRMREAVRSRGMALIAYCPIALARVVGDPAIEVIAAARGRSAAQVTLRWLVQQEGVAAIPRTSRVERLAENLNIFDFVLDDDEMTRMGALARPGSRLVNEPQWVAQWD